MLKKYSWVLLWLPTISWAAEKFIVNHSPYQANIEVEQCDYADKPIRCSGKGKILVTQKNMPNWSQQFTSEDLTFWLDSNKKPNTVMQLYDEQSPLIFDDFNFDGSVDLAIHRNNEGGYGSSTYDVYVYAKNSKKFIQSKELTALASEHQGMFVVNNKQKYLETRDKSGAGWHQINRYSVLPNKGLKHIYEWTEEYSVDGFVYITTKTLTPKGWQTVTKKIDSKKYTFK